MDSIFQIDHTLPIPIYQQLVNSVRAAVRSGTLVHGQQLPTVQELSQSLGLARGTITRTYDALEQEGLVEKVQGRGTFVHCPPEPAGSRKDRAMAAIDELLGNLDAMGFSPAEVNIFLNLKLRQRAEQEALVKIALVECSPEVLAQMARQLQNLPGADLHSYLLGSILQYPYNLDDDLDLIVTTQTHAQALEQLLPPDRRVSPIALGLARECLVAIIKLERWDTAGILCQSQQFGQLLRNTCRTYAKGAPVCEPLLITQEEELVGYLQGKQTLLIPEDLEAHCSQRVLEMLRQFRGKIIRCAYQLDSGSCLYLQEKTKRLLAAKTL